ncbi:cation:proton antiporter [Candidatus Woesearchaeota archaeon]|nr:cation:proton antiporter [Candidatus Woesearchaeota archaeon]
MDNIFLDIGLIIILAGFLASIFRALKQPLIPAYIIAGILLGPVFSLITDTETIKLLAEIGIAFLLFGVGLELDFKKLRDVGQIASIGTVLQSILLFALGYGVALLLGMGQFPAVYMGLVLAFSSTMIIIKVLSDRKELDTLHGRIVIGILLMQDVLAILALAVLNALEQFAIMPIVMSVLQAVVVTILAFFLSKFVLPTLFKFAARYQELLFVISIAFCFVFAIIFHWMGFSIAIGAFIAGVALGNLPYNLEIVGRVKPIKDFFGVLFFASIGLEFAVVGFNSILWPSLIFIFLVVFVSPIITMFVSSLFGYKRKTAFLTSISLSQISEFSLILVMAGREYGHVGEDVFAIVIVLAFVTFSISTYLIKYSNVMYQKFYKKLGFFERFSRVSRELEHISDHTIHKTILIGYDRIGYSILKTLQKMNMDFMVVDFNPDVIKRLNHQNVPCMYGDVSDIEIIEKIGVDNVKLIISTVPDVTTQKILIKKVKEKNKRANIIVTTYNAEDALDLYDLGADYVIIPHFLGGEHASILLEDISVNLDKLISTKLEHIRELHRHKERHPHHR